MINRMLISILAFGVFAEPVLAQTLYDDNHEVREFYNGARAMAMGGASIGVVNDETAMLSNPAGLGKLRDVYGTIIDPELDVSGKISKYYKDSAFTNPFDLPKISASLNSNPNSYYHANAQIFPSVVMKNFGIGFYARYKLDAVKNAAGDRMKTYYLDDMALLLGYNLRLFDGRIKIGFVGKAISRIEIDKDLDTTADMSVSGNASEGLGLGMDGSLMLSAPWTWLPSITAVVRDVGDTKFTSGSGVRMSTLTRPNNLTQDIDVAFSVFPIHSNKVRSSWTFELQKMKESQSAEDKNRYYHFGTELNVADIFFLRAGMNGRYWTAGFELASERTQFQITSYGEDVGADGSPEEDRRLMFKAAFRF